ncbi:MAG: EamA family transporter [Anaerolineales bacterium]|nr:EamA family transporter [Anaerolineales bacterium]
MMNKQEIQGYIYGILTALCWATSPIFIARGLEGIPSSIWATAIGSSVATLIYLVLFLWNKKGKALTKINKKYIYWQIAAGVAGGLGILSRNIALETTRVAIVIGIVQLQILITLVLGPIIQGEADREKITPKLIMGAALILGGTILIIYGRNL